jgi:1-phosphatidylinositol phosphodiesterase
MTELLTIRNLTATPLELKVVERLQGQPKGRGSHLAHKVSGLFNSTSAHAKPKEGEQLEHREVSLPIPCFEGRETDVQMTDASGHEVWRLTLECEGHWYQVDVPTPSPRSTVLRRLDEGAPREFTAVLVTTSGHRCLAIFSSANLACWMRELRDDWSLAALSIPGTHNSPTCHVALPSVRCQAVGPREQLDNGVRFFDVRVQVSTSETDLVLVHSAFPVSLTGNKYFHDLLAEIYGFLDANPSETLIMSIKREGIGKGTDQILSKYLHSEQRYCADANRWWTEPRIPRLGEARGKIVLWRRYGNDDSLNGEYDGRGFGLDAAGWPDNCADEPTAGPGIARVQDFYEIDQSHNIGRKISMACAHLERAGEPVCPVGDAAGGHAPFFVNFLSASNFFNTNCWPEKIAAKVNPAIIEYLCVNHGEGGRGPNKLGVGDACTGIVVTDWVGLGGDWDLLRCVVGFNTRLQLKH